MTYEKGPIESAHFARSALWPLGTAVHSLGIAALRLHPDIKGQRHKPNIKLL